MEKDEKLDLIKKIISEGNVSLDTISREMGIPMANLVLMKRKIDKENSKKKVTKAQTAKDSRYRKIYDNYVSMYYGKNRKKDNKGLVTEENEIVAIATDEIMKIVDSKDVELEKKVFSVLPLIKKIKDEEFSINQANTLIDIYFNRQNLPFPEHDRYADFKQIDVSYKKLLVKKLMNVIKYECDQTDSIDRLRELRKYITPQIVSTEPMSARTVNDKITSKITKIQKESVMNDFENNISNNVSNIACAIASESINMDLIEESIKKETEERMSGQKVKNNFSLTPDQHRKQIFYKVSKALETYAEIYPVYDADKAINAMEKIFGMGITSNFKSVIQNFIERKEYEEAKAICEKYSSSTEMFSAFAKTIDRARTDIVKAEFGDLIVKGLESRATEKEHEQFIKSVDSKIDRLGYMKSSIPLGRCEDKTKKIMLSDIWVDEEISKKK